MGCNSESSIHKTARCHSLQRIVAVRIHTNVIESSSCERHTSCSSSSVGDTHRLALDRVAARVPPTRCQLRLRMGSSERSSRMASAHRRNAEEGAIFDRQVESSFSTTWSKAHLGQSRTAPRSESEPSSLSPRLIPTDQKPHLRISLPSKAKRHRKSSRITSAGQDDRVGPSEHTMCPFRTSERRQ